MLVAASPGVELLAALAPRPHDFQLYSRGRWVLTGARLPRDSAEVVRVGGGWSWVVSAGFPARDRPMCNNIDYNGKWYTHRESRYKLKPWSFRLT